MELVVEPNEEVQLDFAGPLPDELNRDAYILVALDNWSKFPNSKVVTNTTADITEYNRKQRTQQRITGYREG